MTKAEATRRVWKQRQGKGWIVCTDWPGTDYVTTGIERPYHEACEIVRIQRESLRRLAENDDS